ncbi:MULTISPECIES: aromatic amino acid lyase [Burkholderia]|uniref:Aromatic amino acid lyase n=1 Tax=Burkholderia sola TaxID=2843302 RepID=A0ABV2C917_9BURK|nr:MULTISPECIES: aromatic amino acid lyase [unclassified Burkholderia]MBP0607672.1 aromatic amino acid lyase [Burkholderia sp. CpTa8-5]MBP0717643.1 aromatic amino acid lyase [Burkholderia sp. AcTa6-5]
MQANLIAAVATNVGPCFDDDMVRATMIARVNSLARGAFRHHGRQSSAICRCVQCGHLPVRTQQGLARNEWRSRSARRHCALACGGKWKSRLNGEVIPSAEALEKAGLKPMELGFKEGLALINGTSAMTGLANHQHLTSSRRH